MSAAQVITAAPVIETRSVGEDAALIAFVVAATLAVVVMIIIVNDARDGIQNYATAKGEHDAKVADGVRSFADEWVPQVEDIAAILDDLPLVPGVVVREPVLKKDMPGRLVAHARKYGVKG